MFYSCSDLHKSFGCYEPPLIVTDIDADTITVAFHRQFAAHLKAKGIVQMRTYAKYPKLADAPIEEIRGVKYILALTEKNPLINEAVAMFDKAWASYLVSYAPLVPVESRWHWSTVNTWVWMFFRLSVGAVIVSSSMHRPHS
jgi:hypothetical protein